MHILYHFPYSQHGRRVVSLLEEAGLEYELRVVALGEGAHMSPEYLAVNPNHQVPTLVDGDVKIHESNAILRYLCTKHRLTAWYPDDLKARAAVEQWLDWNQCLLSPTVVDIVLNKVFLGKNGDPAAIKRGQESLPDLAAILDAGLSGQDFLAGATPTIADLSVASNIFHLGLAESIPAKPNIKAWYQRINGIEGFQKSLPAA